VYVCYAGPDHWRKGFPYEFSAHVPLLFRWPEKYQPATVMKRGHVENELVTELRDVFPTMLDAAGAMSTVPAGHQIDGMSLLCLLKDPTGKSCTGCTSATGCSADGKGWRAWVDLEHSTCYNATNHWSALTDGKMKYIFNACPTCSFPAKEQLFNLTADPGEQVGLHAMPAYAAELTKWRARMVAQFEKEGRGEQWVKDGQLQLRKPETYGPNFRMYTCKASRAS
jgi:arylsulfatase